jgi:hypothetical protein
MHQIHSSGSFPPPLLGLLLLHRHFRGIPIGKTVRRSASFQCDPKQIFVEPLVVVLLQFGLFAVCSCGFALRDEVVFDQAGETHLV